MRLLMVSQYSNTIIIILCMLYTGLSNTNNLNRLYIYEHLANLLVCTVCLDSLIRGLYWSLFCIVIIVIKILLVYNN